MNLAEAAKKLGSKQEIMDSYWKVQKAEQSWFFAFNGHLESVTSKPIFFDKWSHWDACSPNQKRTLATLAKFREDATDIRRNYDDFSSLKWAYDFHWQQDWHSVFWRAENSNTWTCNVFVGEALYLAGYRQIAPNRHYFSAEQIKNGHCHILKKRKSLKDVKAGDVVVFHNGVHVEIITKVYGNSFCSIGGGRNKQDEIGIEKCDVSNWLFWEPQRDLDDSDNSYFYV